MKSNKKTVIKNEKPFPLNSDALIVWSNSPSGKDGSLLLFLKHYYNS